LETTGTFRSERDVEDLWDTVIFRLTEALDSALRQEKDHEAYLKVKESLITFMTTLEVVSVFKWVRNVLKSSSNPVLSVFHEFIAYFHLALI